MSFQPRDRDLELAPTYWLTPHNRLDATELEKPVGHQMTVPAVAPVGGTAVVGLPRRDPRR